MRFFIAPVFQYLISSCKKIDICCLNSIGGGGMSVLSALSQQVPYYWV